MSCTLPGRRERIEKHLTRRYLTPGGTVLYDLTSTYVEGDHCPLVTQGYSRDGKWGKQQIELGLLANSDRAPVAIEGLAGNRGDPATFRGQVKAGNKKGRTHMGPPLLAFLLGSYRLLPVLGRVRA